MPHRWRLACLLPALLLAGCTWTGNAARELLKSDKVDYKSESTQSTRSALEVPPDLSKPPVNDRFAPPPGAMRAGDAPGNAPPTARQPANPVPQGANARIARDGSERWVVVAGRPDQYWDTVRDFWQDAGFVVAVERPEAGLMETDWAEYRGKKAGEGLMAGLWNTVRNMVTEDARREKFRIRFETNAAGETEIYLSNRGMEEAYRNELERDQTVWTPRAPDPALEAEFLRRLVVRLGGDEARAAQVLASSDKGTGRRSRIVRDGASSAVELSENFDLAWRRVGLALDRVGFTVEDRDRAKGLYFVRYADPAAGAPKKKAEGMFAGLVNFFDRDPPPAEQYQIKLSDAAPATRVAVLSKGGAPENSQTSQRILALLNAQFE